MIESMRPDTVQDEVTASMRPNDTVHNLLKVGTKAVALAQRAH